MRTNIEVENIGILTGHTGCIYTMVADARRSRLYTSGDDGMIVEWDLGEGNTGKAVFRTNQAVYSLCLIEPEGWIAAGCHNGMVYIIDPYEKKIILTYRKYNLSVYVIYTDDSDSKIWILCQGGEVILIDKNTLKELHVFSIGDKNLRSIFPYKDSYLMGSGDGSIYQINKETLQIEGSWEAHNNSVFSLYIPDKGEVLYSGGRDAHLNVWDTSLNFKSVVKIPAHNFTINDIKASPDGNYLLTASRDKTIKVWDTQNHSLLKVIDFVRNTGHTHSVNKICLFPEQNTFVSCGDDKRIIQWEIVNN